MVPPVFVRKWALLSALRAVCPVYFTLWGPQVNSSGLFYAAYLSLGYLLEVVWLRIAPAVLLVVW